MDKELSKGLKIFCEDFQIKSVDDLRSLSSVLEEAMLFGVPLGNGGFIGISDDGYCNFCNTEVQGFDDADPVG